MLVNEQAAVRQYNGELVDNFLPQMDVVIKFFRQNNYITQDMQLHINAQSPVNKPQCFIDNLLQVENGWNALDHFLRCHNNDTLRKNLKQARSSSVACEVPFASTSQLLISGKLWSAPLQVPQFVGRTLLLEKLTKLRGCEGSAGASRHAQPTRILATCAGIGGVGKSSLALEFAYRNLNIYSNIFWISAISKEIIETRFMELAEELKFRGNSTSAEKRSWKDIFLWLHTSSNWLMIFDDAPDYGSIKEYIPRINGDVLITSRYSIWPHQVLNIDAFTKEETLSYISAFLQKADKDAATVLAHELENFPLALAQACAYVVQRHINIETYIEKLKRSRADMLAINILPPDCNSKPVYSTWNITVEQIGKECEFAVTLLEVCSLLEGHSIPDCLLHEFAKNRNQTTEVYEKSRGLLCNYLLLTVVEQNDSTPCVSVHPLVQTITATKLTPDKIYEHCINAQACIHKFRPDLYDKEYGTWSTALMPQLLKCLEHIQLNPEQPLEATIHVQHITNTHTKHTMANKQILQKDAELINASMTYTGNAYKFFGDYHNAKQMLQTALLIAQKLYGAQNTKVADSLCYLGGACSSNGDYKKAKELHEKALQIRKSHYATDHIEVAISLDNLGLVCASLGDYTKAKELLEEALKIRKAHYGADHIVVATSLDNLGLVCSNFGHYTKAKELLEKALKIRELHYDAYHIVVATSLDNLGLVYYSFGDYRAAKELHEKALKIRESHYGAHHIVVATSLDNLGLAYYSFADYTKAKELHEKALKMKEAHYGADHIEVATSLNNLGLACNNLGDYATAKELHVKALKIEEAHYGADHIEVATSLNNLGLVCDNLGDYAKAMELYEKALKIKERHYGADHIEVATSLTNLASAYSDFGDYAKAKNLHEKALKIKELHYGADHIEIATSLNHLGLAYDNLGDYLTAKELLEKALNIRESHYGADHIEVATSFNNLRNVCDNLEDAQIETDAEQKYFESVFGLIVLVGCFGLMCVLMTIKIRHHDSDINYDYHISFRSPHYFADFTTYTDNVVVITVSLGDPPVCETLSAGTVCCVATNAVEISFYCDKVLQIYFRCNHTQCFNLC